MRKLRSWRLTSAHVIALLALFVALGGTAVAVNKASVGSKDIKNGAVKGSKIAKGAVKSTKLAPNSVNSSKIVDGSITSDDLGDQAVTTTKLGDDAVTSAKIADGEIGAGDLGTITVEQNTVQVDAGMPGTADVECPTGSVLLSGGGYWTNGANNLRTTLKQGNGWRVEGVNTLVASAPLTVQAYCLSN